MFLDLDEKLSTEILKMAREFGVDLAGFVDIAMKLTLAPLKGKMGPCVLLLIAVPLSLPVQWEG